MMGYGACYGWDGALGGWMGGGWLVSLLVMALVTVVIVGIVLAVRPRNRSPEDSVEILRGRFVRGEISAEEYEQAKRALSA